MGRCLVRIGWAEHGRPELLLGLGQPLTDQEGILIDEDDNYECADNPDGDHHQLKRRRSAQPSGRVVRKVLTDPNYQLAVSSTRRCSQSDFAEEADAFGLVTVGSEVDGHPVDAGVHAGLEFFSDSVGIAVDQDH
ncbi:MAG: hypothetical protein H8E78_03160, partial [Proteobacteria bacterium]|nr:hypothetical protein [Pseudomonadota bacterium]